MARRGNGGRTAATPNFRHNYDYEEYKAALNEVNTNPKSACKKLEKYIPKHKTDISAQITYARVLIILGRLEEAEMVLNNVDELLVKARACGSVNQNQVDKNEQDYLSQKIRLLGFQGQYKALYDLHKNNFLKVKGLRGLDSAVCWAKKQLGMDRHHKESYKYGQIKRYSEAEFLKHIKKHLDPNDATPFLPSFPLEKILEAIKKQLLLKIPKL